MTTNKSIVKVTRPDAPDPPPTCGGVPGPGPNRLYRSRSHGDGNGDKPRCSPAIKWSPMCVGQISWTGSQHSVSHPRRNSAACSIAGSSSACCRMTLPFVRSYSGAKTAALLGLAAGLGRGAIHLSMSTISTSAASDLAREHARHGQGYVAAPVFGNPDAAKARQLFIVAAGAPADVERCQPVFDSLGQKTFVVGTDPAHANLIKLLGNMMTATTLEMLGEVVAVALKRGLDPKPFVDIMTSTMFGGRAHKIYGDKIVNRSYAPGFVMPLVLKDVRLALAEAENAGAPMPSVNVVRDRLITGIARGYADLDWTALGLIAAEEAGLNLYPSRRSQSNIACQLTCQTYGRRRS